MTRTLADDQARLVRTGAQQLSEPAAGADAAVAQVVTRLVGVQAQDTTAAALALRVRCAGLTAADVEHARMADRSIVRTWCMRGTLHHVPSEDLGWLLGLLGPIFIRASRGRRAQLGLDEASSERAVAALCAALGEHGPLGYRDRSLILTDEQARRVNSGGGMLHPLLLVDGRGAGMWKLERSRTGIDVSVEPFAELGAEVLPGLAAEIDDVRRFVTDHT